MKVKLLNFNEQLKQLYPKTGDWHALPKDSAWFARALAEGLIDETGKRIDYTRTLVLKRPE